MDIFEFEPVILKTQLAEFPDIFKSICLSLIFISLACHCAKYLLWKSHF